MERDIRTLNIGTLGDLCNGRPARQFERAFEDAVEAVLDDEVQRTGPIAKATITITVTIDGTARDAGGALSANVDIRTKLPGQKMSGAPLIPLTGGRFGVDMTDNQARLQFEPRVLTKEG